MTLAALDNLVKTGGLKQEPPDQQEFDGMLYAGRRRLQDAQVPGLSEEGQFSLAYGAAHALSLAALRWHGYRSESRYLVFQCLQHTLGLEAGKWRVVDLCHKRRNLTEYEGHLDVPSRLIDELLQVTKEILFLVERLGPVVE
ncbi:hypothetical protein [Alcanivorax sp.]|uniref:hypothetical protein n=1 Tax=Alcanivorax sp. TaxID=1872427 RepID=UPI002618B4A8|nr:hypothetical protein [Alcanivorax sp.]